MKTPIEKILEKVEQVKSNSVDKEALIMTLCYYKEDEKQAIIEAHCSGELCKKEIGTLTTRSNEYYNQKYNK